MDINSPLFEKKTKKNNGFKAITYHVKFKLNYYLTFSSRKFVINIDATFQVCPTVV